MVGYFFFLFYFFFFFIFFFFFFFVHEKCRNKIILDVTSAVQHISVNKLIGKINRLEKNIESIYI